MDLGHKNLLILPHLLQSNANADQIIEIQQQHRTHAIRLHCYDKIDFVLQPHHGYNGGGFLGCLLAEDCLAAYQLI